MNLRLLCILALCQLYSSAQGRLSVDKGSKKLKLNGQDVFLSGGNLAWINYAHDFGNNQWRAVRSKVENQLKMLRQAGGNTMRVWIHIQGETSPKYNNNGYVVGTDNSGTFFNDFKDMLDLAKKYNILIIPALWNCAVDQDYNHHLDGLIVDTNKLQSYLDKVLKPLVQRVKGHPALAAWDVVNEPEGKIKPGEYNSERCYDTRALKGSGAGFAGKQYNFQQMLRFINYMADAIKEVDPQALVTVGVWNPKSCTDQFGMINHYKDECLKKAGGKWRGTLDLYQFHTYSWQGKFDGVSPFQHSFEEYKSDKPILIGEFDQKDGGGNSIYWMFQHAYKADYAGALSWMLVSDGNAHRPAMSKIKDWSWKGKVNFGL